MKTILLYSAILLVIISSLLHSEEKANEYAPNINVMLRTKGEQILNEERLLFYVRNARFAVKGKINEFISYKAEIDWQDEDEIDMLDAKIEYKPIDNLNFSLGQFKQPFSYEYQKNPFDFDFANRNFINKRMNKGLRDIGAMLDYKFTALIPMHIFIGAYNGNGINTLETDNKKSYSSRIDFFPTKGLRFSLSGVKGNLASGEVEMSNASIEYNNKYIHFDSEIAQKDYIKDNISYFGFYSVLGYHFYPNTKYFNKITPAIRWEMYNKDPDIDKESPRRFTAGITFNIPGTLPSYFRLDYEKYFYKSGIPSGEDKLTLEFAIRVK